MGTVIAQEGNIYNIRGGTPNRANLFHSFGEFSVGAADVARFQTTTLISEPTISNILGRVTGVNGSPPRISNIFGTIDSITFYPNANLFLMNPAGIIFGPNATLNVGGAANFTTANYVRMADEARFYARIGEESALSSAPVAAFGFLGPNFADITLHGINVQGAMPTDPITGAPLGQKVAFVGGNISLVPDPESSAPSTLAAPGRRIQLTSVTGAGEVLAATGEPTLATALGTVILDEGTVLSTVGDPSFGDGSGGPVSIRGGQLVATATQILTSPAVGSTGSGGEVTVSVSGSASLTDVSILTNSFLAGNAGPVSITADTSLTVTNSFVDSSAVFALGDGGPVTLATRGPLSVTDSIIQTISDGSGNAGTVSLTGDLLLSNVQIFTFSSVGGDAGFVTLTGLPDVTLVNGSGSSSFADLGGNAGAFSATGTNVTLDGAFVAAGVTGDGTTTSRSGAVTLTAKDTVTVSDSVIFTTTSDTLADGSPVKISGATVNLVKNLADGVIEAGFNNSVPTSSNGGDIEIRGEDVSLTRFRLGSVASGLPEDPGAGGRIRFLGAENIQLTASDVNTNSTSGGGAGAIEFHTRALTMSELTTVSSNTFGSGPSGTITVMGAENVTLESRSLVTTGTVAQGSAGNILFETQHLTMSGGSALRSDSGLFATGKAGTVTVQGISSPADSVVINGAGSGIFTDTQGTGAGGNITLNANMVALQNGASISSSSSGPSPGTNSDGTLPLSAGRAGTVTIAGSGGFLSDASTVATSSEAAPGGNISISAHTVQLSNGTSISASSNADPVVVELMPNPNNPSGAPQEVPVPGNAGNIVINAGATLLMENSSVTTQATQAGGGDITVNAGDMVQLINSQINTSVAGGAGGGGNITIDPNFVILQNSQILAQAFAGQGGNINITTGVFLADASSLVDASSQFGLSGTVTIQSPTSNLSAVWARLQQNYAEVAAMLRARCAAQVSGQYSSFVQTGRDAIPLEPGGWLLSPISLSADAGRGARGEGARSVVASSVLASEGGILSLRGFDQNFSWPGLVQAPRRFASVLDSVCGS